MVKRLVTQHGSDEVAKRAHVLFTSPPSWLSPPYDIGTLVQHFDKLVDAKPQNRRRERRWDAEGNEVLT